MAREKVVPASGFVDRLNEVKYLEKTSIRAIASRLGYKHNSSIYNLEMGTHGISDQFREAFQREFPQYNFDWLITGKGPMIRMSRNRPDSHENNEQQQTVRSGAIPDGNELQKEVLLEDGDESLPVWDDAMEPCITSGSLVVMRLVKDKSLIAFGQIYQVSTDDWRLVRRIKPSKNPDEWILEATNPQFDNITVPTAKVRSLNLVIGHISRVAN